MTKKLMLEQVGKIVTHKLNKKKFIVVKPLATALIIGHEMDMFIVRDKYFCEFEVNINEFELPQ